MAEANNAELMLAVRELVENTARDHGIFVRSAGIPAPVDKDDWIQFNILGIMPAATRQDTRHDMIPMEVICYSKHANMRADKKFSAPWEVSQIFYDLLNKKRIRIKSSCVQFLEPTSIYLDLRSTGAFAQGIQQSSPQLNIHCVLIKLDAQIIQTISTE